jgi:hypothetical protein
MLDDCFKALSPTACCSRRHGLLLLLLLLLLARKSNRRREGLTGAAVAVGGGASEGRAVIESPTGAPLQVKSATFTLFKLRVAADAKDSWTVS